MKIALVLFPIDAEGGLATRTWSYRELLTQAGHQCDFFRIVYGDSKHRQGRPIRISTTANGLRTENWHLSITDTHLADTLSVLNRYDRIVFCHPCPHTSDTAKAAANWIHLYTETKASKMVTFSDVYLDKYYPHFKDVPEGTYEAWACNQAVKDYVLQFVQPVRLFTHPFVTESRDVPKVRDVMWPNAWRGWKGIKQFLAAAPDIQGTVDLYGTGREYRAWVKENEPAPNMRVHGAVPYGVVLAAMQSTKIAVDLTGFSEKYHGHYNRTMLEAMLNGALVACQHTVVHPYSPIPSELVWMVRKDRIAADINEGLRAGPLTTLQKEAYEWVRDWCDPRKVVREVTGGA